MKSLLKSKIAAFLLFAIIVALIIFTYRYRTEWWMFSDIFFAFMMAFSHLMALTLAKLNPYASRKLEKAAAIFGILFAIIFSIFAIIKY